MGQTGGLPLPRRGVGAPRVAAAAVIATPPGRLVPQAVSLAAVRPRVPREEGEALGPREVAPLRRASRVAGARPVRGGPHAAPLPLPRHDARLGEAAPEGDELGVAPHSALVAVHAAAGGEPIADAVRPILRTPEDRATAILVVVERDAHVVRMRRPSHSERFSAAVATVPTPLIPAPEAAQTDAAQVSAGGGEEVAGPGDDDRGAEALGTPPCVEVPSTLGLIGVIALAVGVVAVGLLVLGVEAGPQTAVGNGVKAVARPVLGVPR